MVKDTTDSDSEGESWEEDSTQDDIAFIAGLAPSALWRLSGERLLRFCTEEGYLDDDSTSKEDLGKARLIHIILDRVQILFNVMLSKYSPSLCRERTTNSARMVKRKRRKNSNLFLVMIP